MSRHQEQEVADNGGNEIQYEVACEVSFNRILKRESLLHIPTHHQKVENEVYYEEDLDYEGEKPHCRTGLNLNALIQRRLK